MPYRPLFYSFTVRGHGWARAYLNDLPLHRGDGPGASSISGSADHLLVPGDNTLAVEVLQAEGGRTVTASVYGVDPHATPMKQDMLHAFSFTAPAPEQQAWPFYHESRFHADTTFEPVWLRAPPATFGPQGTPQMRAAVAELHAAVAAGDVDRFNELNALRLSEIERASPGVTAASAETRRAVARQFFSYDLKAEPLDLDGLRFVPRAGGRIAHVTRVDGRQALLAVGQKEPACRLAADLLLVQHDGAWRLWG